MFNSKDDSTAGLIGKDFSLYIPPKEPWDVVIIGSGYGASVAAATWAGAIGTDGKPVRICVLERGKEYLPGDFPSTLDEFPGHVRMCHDGGKLRGRAEALFDVRSGPDCGVLLGNGLGGGSLINGAVMIRPDLESFAHRFPKSVAKALDDQFFDRAMALLGAGTPKQPNTIDGHADIVANGALAKSKALDQLGTTDCRVTPTAITIHTASGAAPPSETALTPCSLCGDCLTGCNVGARSSLDTQLLAKARRLGVQIYTQASVLRLSRDGGQWQVHVQHTDPAVQRRRGKEGPVLLKAAKVVVAAGSLGSTELLLRSAHGKASEANALVFSTRLGQQFSANGDNVAAIRMDADVMSYGAENEPLADPTTGVSPRRVGPEITRSLSFPATATEPDFRVQEFAVPAALRQLFQEFVTTRQWMDRLTQIDRETHRSFSDGQRDPLGIDEDAMRATLLVGIIGHDSANGTLKLPPRKADKDREGCLRIDWPDLAQDPAMHSAYRRLTEHVNSRLGTHQGEPRLVPNPFWKPVPDALSFLTGGAAGTGFTVHPLGGCCMGEDLQNSVVDEWGAVWDAREENARKQDPWQKEGSLLVLDGAIIPSSLGANPALTIAALSLRAAEHWMGVWEWEWPQNLQAVNPKPQARHPSRPASECTLAAPPLQTRMQIVERLVSEPLELRAPGGAPKQAIVELSFDFEPVSPVEMSRQGKKTLKLNPASTLNALRMYELEDWERHHLHLADDNTRRAHAKIVAGLRGEMHMLDRECSEWHYRAWRAIFAYARNRGGRDGLDFVQSWLRRKFDASGAGEQLALPPIRALASQCGEARTMRYEVQVIHVAGDWAPWMAANDTVQGSKRLAYACGENPWNQLLYLDLKRLGSLQFKPLARSDTARLKLDARFLARRGVALARITEQANQVRALVDQAQFALYGIRLMLKIHLGSFRAPDAPTAIPPRRLPGAVKGLPAPQIIELDMPGGSGTDALPDSRVRLTRYAQPSSKQRPLVMIHGYSASGTSFAHDTLEPGMARHFWNLGRDVWVLDLRTSPGMMIGKNPTAKEPWAFEDVAWADIPLSLCHIADQIQRERGSATGLAVFAHCIGAVMLSMALLTDVNTGLPRQPRDPQRYPDQLRRLQDRQSPIIERLILSQKGFVVEYTDANILRAYLINYAKAMVTGDYSFRPPMFPKLSSTLYDAFLDALPYPHHEWRHEHPWIRHVPWSGTRRRMDALYERTFNIENIPKPVLHHIDDFFGAMNLETVSQVMHFARFGTITDKTGSNQFVSVPRIQQLWPQGGTLLLNAKDNGMVDPHTGVTMENVLNRAGTPHVHRVVIPGGHQDGLIGRRGVSQALLDAVELFI